MSEWIEIKSWPELVLERLADSGVARIVLNRPEKRNCWNRPMCLAFLESLEIIRDDKNLKVVITKGAGPAFSSGLDLTFLREVSTGRCWTGIAPISQSGLPKPYATSRAFSSRRSTDIALAARSASSIAMTW